MRCPIDMHRWCKPRTSDSRWHSRWSSCTRGSRTIQSTCSRTCCLLGRCSGPLDCTRRCTPGSGTPESHSQNQRRFRRLRCTEPRYCMPFRESRSQAAPARDNWRPEGRRRIQRSRCSRSDNRSGPCRLWIRRCRCRSRASRCRSRRSGTSRRRSCKCTIPTASRSRNSSRPSNSHRSCKDRRSCGSTAPCTRQCRKPGRFRSRSPSHRSTCCRRCSQRGTRPGRSPPARREFAFARLRSLRRAVAKPYHKTLRAGGKLTIARLGCPW